MASRRTAASVSEQFLAPWSPEALIAEVYSLAEEKGFYTRWTSVLSAKLKIQLPNGDSDLNSCLQEAPKEDLIACVTALRTELEASTRVRSQRKTCRRRLSVTKRRTSQEKRQAREKRSKTQAKVTPQDMGDPLGVAQPRQSMDVELQKVENQETRVVQIKEVLAVQHMQQQKFTSFEAQFGEMKIKTEAYHQQLLGELKMTQQTIDSAVTALQADRTIQALVGGDFIDIRRCMEEQALAMRENDEQLREARRLIDEHRAEIRYLKTQLDKNQKEIQQGCVGKPTSVTSADAFSEANTDGDKATVSTSSAESTQLQGSYPAETTQSHSIFASSSLSTSSAAGILAGMSQTSKSSDGNMAPSDPIAVNSQYTPIFTETQQVHEGLLSDVGLEDYFHYTIDSGSSDLRGISAGTTPKCCGRIPHALTDRGCILCDQHCLQFTMMTPQQMGTVLRPGFCCPACSDRGCKYAVALDISYVEVQRPKSISGY
ncbi:uncharacterized protein PV06_11163 [Exophiala oligosperma]|uniref:Uncharacterized protein n=1 Tax=Exophiala oligosperma TaxID=215243 RepID=A0A0D2A8K1_9EURO|nr:uncharacterized protein PV06_11163 [Exophiala oligosperma]KIW36651.1 hypothetical protein PV06_11163 [Exophiala oligosperma]